MRYLTGIIFVLLALPALADNGLVNVKSAHDVAATADRLEQVLRDTGMKVFTRIDHAAGAAKVGNTLRPTELVIFGNPAIGSPLMACAQTIAIDLPQKALIWEDESGNAWLTYNNPAYLAERHDTGDCNGLIKKVTGALGKFAKAATMP